MKKTIIAMLLLAMGIGGAQAQQTDDADAKYTQGLLSTGTQAPDFIIKKAKNGVPAVSLSDYRTHPEGNVMRPGCWVLLDFWATWCPDCRKEIPTVKEIYKEYKDMVKLIGVSFDTDKDQLKEFRTKNELKWTMFSEYKKWKETKISSAYNIQWLPTMYLIDPEGKVAYTTVVAEKMQQKLKELADAGKLTKYITKPQYPEGNEAFGMKVLDTVKYPEAIRKYRANAKVKLEFGVDEEGNVSDVTVKGYQGKPLSGSDYEKLSAAEKENVETQAKTLISQAAIKAVTEVATSAKWTPAKERGKAVKGKMSLSVNFKYK